MHTLQLESQNWFEKRRVVAAPASFSKPIAMAGHNKNIVVALLFLLLLPLMLPSMALARRSLVRLPSTEALPVLRKVPTGPNPITSDPPPPPPTHVSTYDISVLREVPGEANPMEIPGLH